MDITHVLFKRRALHDYLYHWLEKLKTAARELPAERVSQSSDAELAAAIVAANTIPVLTIDDNAVPPADVKPAQIPGTDAWGDPVVQAGIRITQTLPFDGDYSLWDYEPSPSSSLKPRGVVLSPSTVALIADAAPGRETYAQHTLSEDRSQIAFFLSRQRKQIEEFMEQAPGQLVHLIATRRRQFATIEQARRDLE